MRTALLGVFTLALACLGPGAALAATDGGAVYDPTPLGGGLPPDTGDGSLTTLFAQNNNFAGNSFDITAHTELTVVGWDINLDSVGAQRTIQVWTRAGTADGFEQVAAGWVRLGSDIVVGAGIDLPTHVDVGGLTMNSGELRGVIVTCLECVFNTAGFHYTNGGPNDYSNADMTVRTYRGLSEGVPAAQVFFPRIWNGTVHYDYAPVPTDERSWGSIKVGYRD
jgi:hypothetical protein